MMIFLFSLTLALLRAPLLTLGTLCRVLFLWITCSFLTLVQANDLLSNTINIPSTKAKENIEIIAVFHAKDARIKKKLTSDNTFIDPEKIVLKNTSVADIVLANPGSDLNGQGGLFQSYNIRGFSRNRIKTEIDGIPIITDRRAGNALSFIPTELISGVNIQKGPSATLYGTGAMGGVVSVSTFNESTSEYSFLIQPQDHGKQIYIKHADDDWGIGALHRTASNSEAANGEPLKTEYKQSFITASKQSQWNDVDIYLSLMANKSTDIGKSSITYPDERISLYPKDNHYLAQIALSQGSDWILKLYHHSQNWQSETDRLEDDLRLSRINISNYKSDTWGSYGQYQYHNTRIGAEWLGRRNINIREQEFDANNELQWENQSVHAQEDHLSTFLFHTLTLNNINIEAGLRFDWIQIEQFSQRIQNHYTSYSLNTSYPINDKTTLNAEMATAFRFPSVSELFYNGETPRGNTQGNPDLAPEESIGYQFSINHQLTPSLSFTLNTYYYRVDNYIERYTLSDDTQDSLLSYRNNNQVTINGLELISHWNVSQVFSTQLGLQLQSGKDNNNDTIDDTLPNAIKWSLYWQPEKFNQVFALSNNVIYQFSKNNVGPSESALNDELIWNTSLSASLTDEQTLTLSLLNLTNNTYRASADEDAPLQPERTLNIKWTVSF